MEEIIIKYLSSEASREECAALEEWIEDPENNKIFQEMRNIWQVARPAFSVEDIDVEKVSLKLSERINRKKNTAERLLLYWQRIAAVLLIPAILLGFLFQRKPESETVALQTVKAPSGSISEFELPDGTKVWLNGGSSLQYPVSFRDDTRTVRLEGEGYFEVESDKEHPFIVNTKALALTATGTAFNIEAYPADTFSAVTLMQGEVRVDYEGGRSVDMVPGTRSSYDSSTDALNFVRTDSYKWCSWKDGVMIFRNDPLEYVFRRLELSFNVDIVSTDPGILKSPYRATFEHESLDEILSLLEMSAPIRFEKQRRSQNSDSTFSRQTIIVR